MVRNDWGPIMWELFHTLAHKLKEENNTEDNVKLIINLSSYIISNLPCPACREHAEKHIKNIIITKIINKEELILFYFNLHNNINQLLLKNKFYFEELINKYSNLNIKAIINELTLCLQELSNNQYKNNIYVKKNIENIINELQDWWNINHHLFNP